MTLRKPGTSVPPARDFPGLLSALTDDGREVVVSGWGEEAEAALSIRAAEINTSRANGLKAEGDGGE